MILKQIYEKDEELTAISIAQFQALFSTLIRDEIQLILPKRDNDIFSEELRILISNTFVTQNQQKIDLKVYNSNSQELSNLDLLGERVVLMTANQRFFAMYTNKQQLHVFSSTTTELICKGLIVQGGCMIESNETLNQILILTLKGTIQVYQVDQIDQPQLNAVQLLFETSIQPILKQSQANR